MIVLISFPEIYMIVRSDGYRKHHTSAGWGEGLVREALSVEINEPYESALAGHINWALPHNGKKWEDTK